MHQSQPVGWAELAARYDGGGNWPSASPAFLPIMAKPPVVPNLSRIVFATDLKAFFDKHPPKAEECVIGDWREIRADLLRAETLS